MSKKLHFPIALTGSYKNSYLLNIWLFFLNKWVLIFSTKKKHGSYKEYSSLQLGDFSNDIPEYFPGALKFFTDLRK